MEISRVTTIDYILVLMAENGITIDELCQTISKLPPIWVNQVELTKYAREHRERLNYGSITDTRTSSPLSGKISANFPLY